MDNDAPQKRYTRFGKIEKAQPVRLSKEMVATLRVVEQMCLCRSSLIVPLAGLYEDGTLRRLQKLRKAKLIEKEQHHGSNISYPDVYKITEAGRAALKAHFPHTDDYVRLWQPKTKRDKLNPEVRGKQRHDFIHSLQISDFIGNLRLGAYEYDFDIGSIGDIERLKQPESNRPLRLTAKAPKHPYNPSCPSWSGYLEPDGLFFITYNDGTKSYFALEAQNYGKVRDNTFESSSVLRKAVGYAWCIKERVFEEEWGITNLNVVFTFAHQEHYNEAKKLLLDLFEGTPFARLFRVHYAPNYRISEKSGSYQAPYPNPSLLTTPMWRPGAAPKAIYVPEEDPT